jgi:hypothetical protein
MYTDKALLMRESLKFDPQVLSALEEIWEAVDNNQSGGISKDEYFLMSLKLNQVFNEPDEEDDVWHEGEDSKKVTANQGAGGDTALRLEAEAMELALAQAEEDWAR